MTFLIGIIIGILVGALAVKLADRKEPEAVDTRAQPALAVVH
jgi:hypothetical protein